MFLNTMTGPGTEGTSVQALIKEYLPVIAHMRIGQVPPEVRPHDSEEVVHTAEGITVVGP